MRILLTGFEPFGGDSENASEATAMRLAERWNDPHHELVVRTLPVSFVDGVRAIDDAVVATSPDLVVALGEAGGRSVVTPESTAKPLAQARIPDNTGNQPLRQPLDAVVGDLHTGFDVDGLAAAIRGAGIAAAASHDAGAFVCNAVFRAVLRQPVPGIFVHVPALRTTGTAAVGAETDASAAPVHASVTTIDELTLAVEAVIHACLHQLDTAYP